MESTEEAAGQSQSPPICRVAIIGAQRQRVAKVTALLHADDSLRCVSTSELLSSRPILTEGTDLTVELPKGVPPKVEIEYLPCVATFDSYEDEYGASVRYLVKLEYHGPNGTLIKGKSLAPFFDEIDSTNGDNNEGEEQLFPAIAAAAIGCGIDTEEDVGKIQSILETLSASCAAQISSKKSDEQDGQNGMKIESIKPNAEYSSMKEENEAFRDMSNEEKKEASNNGIIGPGKMANFAHKVAKDAVRQRWNKDFTDYEQSIIEEMQKAKLSEVEEVEGQSELTEPEDTATPEETQSAPAPHIPNPEKTRYACKRCRTILFGVDDLEDPPHAQSQHTFRKRGMSSGYGSAGPCQNHCLAQTLSWMDECADMEGKLHCPKCNTKVGHYSWTGAQCSCGTWVTPAIMVPVSKVDEMKPISQNIIASTGSLFVDHSRIVGASPNAPQVIRKD